MWGAVPAFGSSGTPLGLSWTLLGCLLGNNWALLGVSWLVWVAYWGHLTSQSLPRPRFWKVWGFARLGFGRLQGHVLACVLLASHFVTKCFYSCSNRVFSFTCALRFSLLVRRSVQRTSAACRRESRACRISPRVLPKSSCPNFQASD